MPKNPIDLHVGKQIRHRRWLLGMTQQQLAQAVGIRFQQVQKYESGANRVSASRLWDLAHALDTPVTFFFDGLQRDAQGMAAPPAPQFAEAIQDKDTHDMLRAFIALEQGPRRRVLDLVVAMKEMNDPRA